jgi:hypothetical protein
MVPKLLAFLRVLLAVLAGNVAMALLITVGFKAITGGSNVDFETSSGGVLLLTGACALASAVVGGYLSAWISGPLRWIAAALLVLWVVFETSWLHATGRSTEPLWFSALGGLNLVVGLVLGTWLRVRTGGRRVRPAPAV